MDAAEVIESRLVMDGSFVRVDGFANHRIDLELMDAAAVQLARTCAPHAPDLVVTAEASGIAPAVLVARELGVDMVFAKKTIDEPPRTTARHVPSPTKHAVYWLGVRDGLIEPNSRVAIVDDILASGRAAEALTQIVRANDAEVVCYGFLIEKSWLDGRQRLETSVPATSLVSIPAPEGDT